MQRFSKGMMAGILIGAAVEMAIMPYYDRRTQRTMKRAGKRMRNMAESTYSGIQDWMRLDTFKKITSQYASRFCIIRKFNSYTLTE